VTKSIQSAVVYLALGCALTACKAGDAPAQPNATTDLAKQLTDDASPATIFGDLLVEDWDSRSGATITGGAVTGWTGKILSTTVTPPRGLAPTLAADGTLFGGQPVVQCANGQQLQVYLPAPIVEQGTRPYFAFVGRLRATRTDDKGAGLVAFNHVNPVMGDAGVQVRVNEGGNWSAYYRMGGASPEVISTLPNDTGVHLFEEALNGDSGINFFLDGRQVARWSTEDGWPLWYVQKPLQQGLDLVTFCPIPEQSAVPLSLAEVVLLKARPTDAQRAAFLAYAESTWNVAYCGDGKVDPGEACDDGNMRDGDGCRKDCTTMACGAHDAKSCQPACDATGGCKAAALDPVSVEPAAAYSVSARVRSIYKGAAFRVRCEADGTEANIGFDPTGQIDEAGLSDACRGGDGYLRTLYDQSSHGRDLPQSDPSLQLKIYDGASRAMVKRDGRPVLSFSQAGKNVWGLDSLELSENPALTVAYVGRAQASGPNGAGGGGALRLGVDESDSPVANEIAFGFDGGGDGSKSDFIYFGSGSMSWPGTPGEAPYTSVFIHGNGATVGESVMRIDGQTVAPTGVSGGTDPFHFGLGRVLVGKHPSDSSGAVVDLQTAVFWNAVLAGEDIVGLELGLKASSDPCVVDPAACECPSNGTLRTPTTIAGHTKLWACFDPNASQCEARVHGRAKWDRQQAAQRFVAKTMHAAEQLALARDRVDKVRAAEVDPALMQAICDGDADGDFVPDAMDACPATAELKATGPDGCELTTLPRAVPDEVILAMLERMGVVVTPGCKNAEAPFTPTVFPHVDRDVSSGRYVFLLTSRLPASITGCPTFYQFEGTITRADGTSRLTQFMIGTTDPRVLRPSPLGAEITEIVLHVTDDPEFASWGSDANHIRFHVREVNGGGQRSAWSEWMDRDIRSGL
jgi:cysteine-rich repeat protein